MQLTLQKAIKLVHTLKELGFDCEVTLQVTTRLTYQIYTVNRKIFMVTVHSLRIGIEKFEFKVTDNHIGCITHTTLEDSKDNVKRRLNRKEIYPAKAVIKGESSES